MRKSPGLGIKNTADLDFFRIDLAEDINKHYLYNVGMANHNITDKEKLLVIDRLSQGFSTREAIEGTSIKSNSTAANIAKEQSHLIAQHRKAYLWGIEEEFGASMAERARMWAAMAHATKHSVINYVVKQNTYNGVITKIPIVDEVPDWRSREKALRYIDGMAESVLSDNMPRKLQLNLIQNSSGIRINN